MHSYRLISGDDEWRLQWDDATFVLTKPDGEAAIEVATSEAYRVLDIGDLYDVFGRPKISFRAAFAALTFPAPRAVVKEVRALVDEGLRRDAEYRRRVQGLARGAVVNGAGMTAVGWAVRVVLLVGRGGS